jgi:hypothetical protein
MWWECSECGCQFERVQPLAVCDECGTAGAIFTLISGLGLAEVALGPFGQCVAARARGTRSGSPRP